jgi:hypothetical protein
MPLVMALPGHPAEMPTAMPSAAGSTQRAGRMAMELETVQRSAARLACSDPAQNLSDFLRL